MLDTLELRPKQGRDEYDTQGWVCRQTQADGGIWLLYYVPSDASGTGPGQQILAEAAAGGPISTPPCTGLGTASTVLATVTVDPRGNPTTHRFNSNGYLIAQTDALGQTTAFARANGTNLLLSVTDPLGRVTRFAHDGNGNVISITNPAGDVATFTYDPALDKVTSVTDPLGNVTRFTYDAKVNLTSITRPLGNVTSLTYDTFGQLVSRTDPLGNVVRFEHDTAGNLVRIIDPLGNTTQRTYDLVSRLIAQADPRGKTKRLAYDELNRVTQVVDALNGVTALTYDGNGNLLTVTDPRGNTITHTYDSLNRLATRTDSLNQGESFAYDLNGNLTQFTDRKGQISTFIYDPLDRRIRSDFADGIFTEFAYNLGSRLIRASDSQTGTILKDYDALDRLTRETTPQGTVTYSYDALSRRTAMTVEGQPPVRYTYDANSRLTQLGQDAQTVTISYDASGRRTLLGLPNGVSTEYQYDAASRLTALIYRNAVAVLGDLTYQYDAAGNRIAIGGSFARTLVPNPVASASYDAANRQRTFGAKTMTFDANGNLATIADPAGTTTLTWDARNRLTALSGPAVTASFGYDAFNRRTQKVIGTVTTTYQYDGATIIREIFNGTEATYLGSLNLDERFSRTDTSTATVLAYLTDALGSTLALADSSGVQTTSYTYEPFGRTASAGALNPNPFQFTGRENDGIGFYYYRARYYHPQLHRFVSGDPLGLAAGDVNLYAYVGNDPLNVVDPEGLSAVQDFLKGVGSYFRGVYGTFRYASRYFGLLGACEQRRAELEALAVNEAIRVLVASPEVLAVVFDVAWDLSIDYVKRHPAKVAGRFLTAAVITAGLSKHSPGYGTALAYTLTLAATAGNIRLAIERGGRDLEAIVRAVLGGDVPLLGPKESDCQ